MVVASIEHQKKLEVDEFIIERYIKWNQRPAPLVKILNDMNATQDHVECNKLQLGMWQI